MQARKAGINAELFPECTKMKKQMAYANAKQVPFVAIVGESELQEQKLTLKDMNSGEQKLVTPSELVEIVQA